jgi:hypothetical protein
MRCSGELPMSRGKSVTYVLGTFAGLAHNVPRVCDVAPRPTGHVAERRAAAPQRPSRLKGGDAHYALLCAVVPGFKLIHVTAPTTCYAS